MTNRFYFRNGRVVFRNDVLDELGLEIEWSDRYLNLIMNGESIHYRTYTEGPYICEVLPFVDKWTKELSNLITWVNRK